MPADDTLLGQNLVDVRNRERMTRADSEWVEMELSFCTQTEDCQADVADHLDGCPVEEQLRETFGF